MKKILILGANSYIGTSFEKYISANYPGKYEIRRTSLRGTAWQQEDWSSYDSILNVTGKAHADIASLTEEQKREYYTVNCDLAVEAAKKAIAAGAGQYIYLSSIIVYGDSSNSRKPVRITADTKPNPSNFYGDSKWQAEQRLQELFADRKGNTVLAIVRPPMIYGAGSKGNYRMLQKLAEKLPVFPTYHNERSMLYVENLAELLRILAEEGREGIFLPQNEEYVCTADMVYEIARAKGRKIWRLGWLNPLVGLAFFLPGRIGSMVRKAFGSMTIDWELSPTVQGYQRFDLEESVRRSI